MTTTRREQIAAHEEELHILWRRARRLQLYQAQYGLNADTGPILELEDVEAQITQLQQTLTQLRNVTPDAQAPYLGLKTFDETHARFFYGREALIDTLVERVKHTAFLTVIGPSGSGKSSVVRAGLIPALKQGLDLAGSDQWIYVPPFPPGPRPMNALAAALTALPNSARVGTAIAIEDRLKLPDGLLFCADQLLAERPGGRLVLVVDQAEELWTLAPSDKALKETHRREQQQPFIAQLLSVTQAVDRRVLVILTLRADFMGRVAGEPTLAAVVKQQLEIVSPMDKPDLRRAIELPAEVAGGTFQPGLVDELIDQVAGEPGALPLLEYTLESLWAAKESDGTLTWEAYRKIGGVEGALAQGADHVLDNDYAKPEQRDAIREVLLRLVQPGDGSADSRRRVPLRDLVPAGSTVESVQALITPLVNARLLTTGREADTAQDTVEVTHEALIRLWPTLRDWIASAKADLRLQRQLEDAAREWEAEESPRDFLWQGVRLAHAEAWAAQAHPLLLAREHEFLVASRAAETARTQAERRRTRSIIVGLIVALVLITGFAGGTFWFWRAADRTGRVSQARFLVAEGQRRYDAQPLFGLRLMAEGLAVARADKVDLRNDLAAAVRGYMWQGRVRVLARNAMHVLAIPWGDARALVITRRDQPGVLVWSDHLRETVLPSPLTIAPSGQPVVEFSPQGKLGVLSYADGKGAALLPADRTLVPLPYPLAIHRYGRPVVKFSPQGQFGVLSYANGKGSALLRADGTLVPLPYLLATNSSEQLVVEFSPQGQLGVLNYADGKGSALLRADGAVVPLPRPLATDSYGQLVVEFSPQGKLVAVSYANGKGSMLLRADGTLVPLPYPIATNSSGEPLVKFSPQGQLGVLNYAEGKGAALLHADGTLVPLPSPLATDNSGQLAVVFSPQGQLGVLNYADGKGAALLRADGTLVPLPYPIATRSYGGLVVEFSPQGQLVAVSSAEGQGTTLLRADGTLVPLPYPLATNSSGQPVVEFSAQGQLGVLNYAEGQGAALLRADGTLVPLPYPLATNSSGQPVVKFSAQGQFVAVSSAEGQGAALLRADGTLVPLPRPLAIDSSGRPVIAFSPQGQFGVLNYAEGQGAALVRADGTIVPLPRSLATSSEVAFSPQGRFGVLNYAEGQGAALVRADGTLVPLPHPLATYSYGYLAITFSDDDRLVALEYATGNHELRTLGDLTQVIDLRSNVDSVVFMASGSQIVVFYRNGYVYVVDPRLLPAANDASKALPAGDLISFICNSPLKSGFWTPQDDADLAEILQGAAPQACR
jgi:hypothetical protein